MGVYSTGGAYEARRYCPPDGFTPPEELMKRAGIAPLMGLLQREELRTLIKHRTLHHFSPVGLSSPLPKYHTTASASTTSRPVGLSSSSRPVGLSSSSSCPVGLSSSSSSSCPVGLSSLSC